MKSIKRSVLIMCDSLRRDLIDSSSSPVLSRLANEACWFSNARGVFPSTTRVSSASIATGCLPARHGLLGNTMILPEAQGLRCRSVGEPDFREHMRRATGQTLKAPTMAQRVADHGGACIMSNVSAGAAYFHDPDAYGEVYHRAGSYGPGNRPYTGAEAMDIPQGAPGDVEMTARFCRRLVGADAPVIATLWLSEPDHTGHATALGSPRHLAAIRHANQCIEQVLDAVAILRRRGEDILLMVASDHGMETVIGEVDVGQALVQAGLKAASDSRDVVLAPNGSACIVALAPEARGRGAAIREYLDAQPWVGSTYAGAQLAGLGLPVDNPGCALAIALRHSAQPNEHGVPGSTWIAIEPEKNTSYQGRGQHGGLGPNEQSPFLIAQGGGYAAGGAVSQAVRLIDFAPTMLRHIGLPFGGMDGAPLPFPDYGESAPIANIDLPTDTAS